MVKFIKCHPTLGSQTQTGCCCCCWRLACFIPTCKNFVVHSAQEQYSTNFEDFTRVPLERCSSVKKNFTPEPRSTWERNRSHRRAATRERLHTLLRTEVQSRCILCSHVTFLNFSNTNSLRKVLVCTNKTNNNTNTKVTTIVLSLVHLSPWLLQLRTSP